MLILFGAEVYLYIEYYIVNKKVEFEVILKDTVNYL